MHCPFCSADKDRLKVIDSRSCEDGRAIRRRRVCGGCGKRFTTHERVEVAPKLTVVKGSGGKEPWDRRKIIAGVERAAFKLDVTPGQIEELADAVEDEALRNHEKEVPSVWIGEHVGRRLAAVNEVAYVRFASVYKRFQTSEEFLEEATRAIEGRPSEDDQPGLFAAGDLRPPTPVVQRGRKGKGGGVGAGGAGGGGGGTSRRAGASNRQADATPARRRRRAAGSA